MRKTQFSILVIVVFAFSLTFPQDASAGRREPSPSPAAGIAASGPAPAPALPAAAVIDLKRLEEAWRILDLFADKIWPGWAGYRDVPFMFEYPNGLRMLVGHPHPTDEFAPAEGIDIQGKTVHLDRSGEKPFSFDPPIIGGGGIIPYGKGTPIPIVRLTMRKAAPTDAGEDTQGEAGSLPPRLRISGDSQILLNIHELFHVFQGTQGGWRYGNLRMNPDLDFAVYAEIEGLALEKAFFAEDDAAAGDHLKDFLAARMLKRKNMTELERNQESENEVMEGTAVYTEAMALRLIRDKGYEPLLAADEDPYYFGFEDAELLFEDRVEALRRIRKQTLDSMGKLYRAGCFEALLLSRLFPGWQENFLKDGRFLDAEIGEKLGFTNEATAARAGKLDERYPVEEIVARHKPVIQARDAALKTVREIEGRAYIVNVKPIGEFLVPGARGESYRVGLINIYPQGFEKFEAYDVLLTGAETLILTDQLYYFKWVDTDAEKKDTETREYELTYSRKEGEDIFYDAEFKTKGFTLKAPKIRVKDTPARVKVTVLEKVGAGF